jgi:hypothetical protein
MGGRRVTDATEPGNLAPALNAREIFEEAMKQLGWSLGHLERNGDQYTVSEAKWAWIAWQVARNAALIQVALWYKEKGWLMDEDDIPQAIMDLSKPT